MNRKIKFRAWIDTEDEGAKMLKWNRHVKRAFGTFVSRDGNGTAQLMQYTGIRDKDGRDIYEGDYLAIEDTWTEVITDDGRGPREPMAHLTKVYWDNGAFKVDIGEYGDVIAKATFTLDKIVNDLAGQKRIEVIGNQFENPNLLDN